LPLRTLPVLLTVFGVCFSTRSLPALDEVLWERNKGWSDAGVTYFDGARCAVEGPGSCPREMGWQGNELAWEFPLAADADRTSLLRFELSVDRVFHAVSIEVSAGPAGETPASAGSLELNSPGVYRILVPSEKFRAGSRNQIILHGDNAVGFGEPAGIRWMSAGLYRHYPDPPSTSDEDLLDDTQWRACRYFHEQALPRRTR
jgi:hypothetical protein